MLKSDKLIIDKILDNSDAVKSCIRCLSKFYRLSHKGEMNDEIISIVAYAKLQADATTEEEFIKYLKKEFRNNSQKSCAAFEHFDALRNCDEDDDEASIINVQQFLKGSEAWRVEALQAVSPKLQRLLDAAEGGASIQEIAKKLGMTRVGASKLVARELKKLEACHA